MADYPADIGGGEHAVASLTAVDVLHRGRQGHGITTRIALHPFGLAGSARGVEDVGRMAGFDPFHFHLCIHVCLAQSGIVQITSILTLQRGIDATIDNHHFFRRVLRQLQGFIH